LTASRSTLESIAFSAFEQTILLDKTYLPLWSQSFPKLRALTLGTAIASRVDGEVRTRIPTDNMTE